MQLLTSFHKNSSNLASLFLKTSCGCIILNKKTLIGALIQLPFGCEEDTGAVVDVVGRKVSR